MSFCMHRLESGQTLPCVITQQPTTFQVYQVNEGMRKGGGQQHYMFTLGV